MATGFHVEVGRVIKYIFGIDRRSRLQGGKLPSLLLLLSYGIF